MLKSLFLATLPALIAAAPATTTTSPVSVYREAFAQIDKMNEADRGRIGLCGSNGCWVVTTPLDQSTSDLLKQQKQTVELLRKISAMDPPVWQFNGDPQKMVELTNHAPFCSSLLVLQARHELAEKQLQQAVDDLVAAIAISRHVGAKEPTLLVKMVESMTWRPAGTELAEQLPTLPKELVAALPDRLARLPKSPTTADVIRGEYAFAQMTAKRQGFAVVAMVAGLRDFYKALLDGSDRNTAEFDKLVDEQAAKYANNPFVPIMAPQFKHLRRNVAQLEAKHAMLLTAIDILQKGDSALATSKDPGGDGPFTMQRSGNGFVLTSAVMASDQKPLTLRIGRE